MRKFLAGVCLFSSIMISLIQAGDNAKTVALPETPAAVQRTIAAQIGGGKVGDIQRARENGEMVFEVDYAAKSGEDHDFTVAEDGTLLSIGITLAETPAAVQKTIQAQLPGWEITGINKNLADTEVSFDVEASKGGRERSFNVDNNGVLSSMEVSLTETPAAVHAAIKAQIGDGTLQSIDEDFDPDGNSFDVEATAKDGSRKTFSIALDGRLLSEGVTLAEVPPAARKTIEEKISGGRILEIDKTLLERKVYEVQARKNGREFDFSVGPRGRFLGMDE